MATRNFPVWLQGTEEQQQAEADVQALALASHSRAKMSEAERLIGRGRLLEEAARLNLEQSKGKDKEARILGENQLADALAMQGRYAEAAETHNDKHRRKMFREIVKALEMPDDETCNCSDRRARIGNEDVAITPRFEREKIFSPVHNESVSLVECSKCGHQNARPLMSRLLPQQAALAQNEAIARTTKAARFIGDTQVLKGTQ